jgi:hypothetical protein
MPPIPLCAVRLAGLSVEGALRSEPVAANLPLERLVDCFRIPDSYEVRLVLGQEIGKYVEFAGNIF